LSENYTHLGTVVWHCWTSHSEQYMKYDLYRIKITADNLNTFILD